MVNSVRFKRGRFAILSQKEIAQSIDYVIMILRKKSSIGNKIWVYVYVQEANM